MINENIKFPILELTDWIFDSEKVLEVEYKWAGPYYIKEKDFEKHYQRLIIDCTGSILKVMGGKILRKENTLFSFFIPPTLVVDFDLEITGKTMTLNQAKSKILSRSWENFHITETKLISEEEYNRKVNAANNFEELFNIASINDIP